MRCEIASEWMSLRLDGQLAPTQIALLEIHLSGCAACQWEWATMQRIAAILSAAPEVMPPAGFVERVMQRLGRKSVPGCHN